MIATIEHKRQFVLASQAWYASATWDKDVVECIHFGRYSSQGGTVGEMRVEWRWLAGKASAQLQAWDDSWEVLASFADVIARLGSLESTQVTPYMVITILKECGFEDNTARTPPASARVISQKEIAEQKDLADSVARYFKDHLPAG